MSLDVESGLLPDDVRSLDEDSVACAASSAGGVVPSPPQVCIMKNEATVKLRKNMMGSVRESVVWAADGVRGTGNYRSHAKRWQIVALENPRGWSLAKSS